MKRNTSVTLRALWAKPAQGAGCDEPAFRAGSPARAPVSLRPASAPALVWLALLLAAPALLPAQVRQAPTIKIKSPKEPRLEKFKGQVVNFTPVAITVHDLNDFTLVRTFRFNPELERKLERRYVENGDKVTVYYLKGGDTAVKLKGKIRLQGSPYVKPRR